jgi:hypothetical protein
VTVALFVVLSEGLYGDGHLKDFYSLTLFRKIENNMTMAQTLCLV